MRDLHVFFDVVQSGSMAKATAQLCRKQPPVSDRRPPGIRPAIYRNALIECGVEVLPVDARQDPYRNRRRAV
jgi:hypothetical protein